MRLPLREQKGETAKETRNEAEDCSFLKTKDGEEREDEAKRSEEAKDTTMAAIWRSVRLYLFIVKPQRDIELHEEPKMMGRVR